MGTGINFLREPLLHFLFIGAALFFVFYTTQDRSNFNQSKDIIVISPSDINRLAYLFEKTWQRPPNDQELRGIVNENLKEEVLYREALKLGLDKDDTVVRRRMRQKMEFIIDDISEQTEPTNEQLEEFLKNHKDKFRVESQISFQQLFFKADRGPDKLKERINDIKNKLNKETILLQDAESLANTTILPRAIKLATLSEIDNQFGRGFASQLSDLDQGQWIGPIKSEFGFHLVLTEEKVEEYIPKLSEIRRAVEREWQYLLKKDLEKKYFQDKFDQYTVDIRWPNDPDSKQSLADKYK